MYEGIDFIVLMGMLIVVVVDGVIIVFEYYLEFGNMIDVDYGEGFVFCYVYLLSLDVKVGMLVKGGEWFGVVGNIGWLIGLYLYFEVWMLGVVQNLVQFLKQG